MDYLFERNQQVLNAITIDVEEWYQTILFNRERDNNIGITDLLKNMCEILSLLDRYNTKATFFIVGTVAEKYPDIVKMIAEKGHEIASHGYLHRLVYRMSKQDFIKDVGLSIDILRRDAQVEILGYRAPTWSIMKYTHWAIDVLKSLGLRYDSSIYPASTHLFNCKDLKKFPYEIRNDFIEFPPSTFQFLGYNFPFAGGTFLRFFSFNFIKNRIMEINRKEYSAMVYFHSWEFSDEGLRLNIPKWKYFIQYGNLRSVKVKLKLLLENFKFSSIREVLQLNNMRALSKEKVNYLNNKNV